MDRPLPFFGMVARNVRSLPADSKGGAAFRAGDDYSGAVGSGSAIGRPTPERRRPGRVRTARMPRARRGPQHRCAHRAAAAAMGGSTFLPTGRPQGRWRRRGACPRSRGSGWCSRGRPHGCCGCRAPGAPTRTGTSGGANGPGDTAGRRRRADRSPADTRRTRVVATGPQHSRPPVHHRRRARATDRDVQARRRPELLRTMARRRSPATNLPGPPGVDRRLLNRRGRR
jgi:hypothetical protein